MILGWNTFLIPAIWTPRHLRLSETDLLTVPEVGTGHSEVAFSFYVVHCYNKLPEDFKFVWIVTTFKNTPKTVKLIIALNWNCVLCLDFSFYATKYDKKSAISKSHLSFTVSLFLLQETKVRLERREIREKLGRTDHQDFQVSPIHSHLLYILYKVEENEFFCVKWRQKQQKTITVILTIDTWCSRSRYIVFLFHKFFSLSKLNAYVIKNATQLLTGG